MSTLRAYTRIAAWMARYEWPWINWHQVFLLGLSSEEQTIREAMRNPPTLAPDEEEEETGKGKGKGKGKGNGNGDPEDPNSTDSNLSLIHI